MQTGLLNMQVLTCRGADDGLMTIWRDGGWYECGATVNGQHVTMRYMDYTKKEVLARFRAHVRDNYN